MHGQVPSISRILSWRIFICMCCECFSACHIADMCLLNRTALGFGVFCVRAVYGQPPPLLGPQTAKHKSVQVCASQRITNRLAPISLSLDLPTPLLSVYKKANAPFDTYISRFVSIYCSDYARHPPFVTINHPSGTLISPFQPRFIAQSRLTLPIDPLIANTILNQTHLFVESISL